MEVKVFAGDQLEQNFGHLQLHVVVQEQLKWILSPGAHAAS